MRIELNQAIEMLNSHDNILILAHRNPDGDALGSGYALCRALRSVGKNAEFKYFDKIPKVFLELEACCENTDFEPSFVVAVDCADSKILGDFPDGRYKEKVDLCIDHHSSNTLYAKYTYLDDNAAATSEIILDIARAIGAEIDTLTAQAIYIGLSTDTGCFRYSNTTSKTMRMAADMMDAGINAGKLNRILFETKSKSYAALEAMALATLTKHFSEKCAIMHITLEMHEKSGTDETEIHALASLPRQIEDVLVGATIKEAEPGRYKVSIRTNPPVNASEICQIFGGGGHKRAAGCEIHGTLSEVKKQLLDAIEPFVRDVDPE